MDATDRRIAAQLQAEPRLRIAELARRIGLSGPAVADRLRRLEETGTLSYRAEVDPRALGYTLFAIVRISPSGGGLRLIPGIAREVPAVTECFRITGEDCFFIKVYLHSIDELEPILDLFTPHGRTTTSIVHSAPVPPRPLPVSPCLCHLPFNHVCFTPLDYPREEAWHAQRTDSAWTLASGPARRPVRRRGGSQCDGPSYRGRAGGRAPARPRVRHRGGEQRLP